MRRKPSLSLVPSEAEIAARPKIMRPHDPRPWWRRWRAPEPTAFHRCLAIHMTLAGDPAAWVRFNE